jgi:hypothetical protein
LAVRAVAVFRFGGLGYTGCGGDVIAFIYANQPDALRRAARLADLAGFDPDNLSILGDDH